MQYIFNKSRLYQTTPVSIFDKVTDLLDEVGVTDQIPMYV